MEEHPFRDLLPELYGSDPVLRGMIGSFEALYLQIERRIDTLPGGLYDLRNTPDGFLDFLGRLVGLRNENGLFLPSQMRALIPVAYRIQRKKGTRQALLTLLRVYMTDLCGHPVTPAIFEYEDWRSAQMPPRLAAAYADIFRSESDFLILLPPEPLLQDAGERARLEQLVKLYSPATANAHIVVSGVDDGMQDSSWLGINIYL